MCLDKGKRVKSPRRLGYKVVKLYRSGNGDGTVTYSLRSPYRYCVLIPDHWDEVPAQKMLEYNFGEQFKNPRSYPSGFHVLPTLEAAKLFRESMGDTNLAIVPVSCRKIVAEGEQDRVDVFVAKSILYEGKYLERALRNLKRQLKNKSSNKTTTIKRDVRK